MKLPDHITHNTIETPRLLLREISPDILQYLYTEASDEDIMNWLGLNETELATERHNHSLGLTTYRISFRNFVLVDKATNIVIGKCGYHTWYLQHARAEIGYNMRTEEVKNKGYMTEALGAILKYGFEHMDLNRVEALIGSRNEPSQRLVKRYGFKEEGTLRAHYYKNGIMEDSVCYGLLRSEYEALSL